MKDAYDQEMIARERLYFNTIFPEPDPELFDWLEAHHPQVLKCLQLKDQLMFELKLAFKTNRSLCRQLKGFDKDKLSQDERVKALDSAIKVMGISERRIQITSKLINELTNQEDENF